MYTVFWFHSWFALSPSEFLMYFDKRNFQYLYWLITFYASVWNKFMHENFRLADVINLFNCLSSFVFAAEKMICLFRWNQLIKKVHAVVSVSDLEHGSTISSISIIWSLQSFFFLEKMWHHYWFPTNNLQYLTVT